MDMKIAVYKEPERRPYLIATFGHLMDLTDDTSMHNEHIGLEASIAKAGSALIGTEEELKKHIEDVMNLDMKYVSFVCLYKVNRDKK